MCIIHYKQSSRDIVNELCGESEVSTYSKIKDITPSDERRITEAKHEHELRGSANCYQEQCKSIPEKIIAGIHGMHNRPCYQNFTRILNNKKTVDHQQVNRKPDRLLSSPSSSSTSAWVYPKECNLCHKYQIKRNGKYFYPITISTYSAVNTIMFAAKFKDESLFIEIKDLCLIAKEFKYHELCYRDFTRDLSKYTSNISTPPSLLDKGEDGETINNI